MSVPRGQPFVKTAQEIKLEPRHDYAHNAGWSRKVTVDGVSYVVGIERGKRVQIPFKPRGTYGYKYFGFVRNAAGKEVWSAAVGGSLGAKGLLMRASIVWPEGGAK